MQIDFSSCRGTGGGTHRADLNAEYAGLLVSESTLYTPEAPVAW